MDTCRSRSTKGISNLLFDADIARIAQDSEQSPYDVVVIGSGMGGGVLAHSLCDLRQRVLLLERGDLLFTTHSLNTTRPHADLSKKTGPTQDNDIVYGLLKETVKTTDDSDEWAGGPLYCVGGRSNAWGLYIPRIDNKTLNEYFPKEVVEDLIDNEDPKKGNYYKRAEYLMHNKKYEDGKPIGVEPRNEREHMRDHIKKLTKDERFAQGPRKETLEALLAVLDKHDDDDDNVDVKPIAGKLHTALQEFCKGSSLWLDELHWALLGAQFNARDLYEFPQGAFSSTDRLLEFVFRSHSDTRSRMSPPFLTVLHNTTAIELCFEKDVVRKVKTVTASGLQHTFRAKKVVICAGTLDSPALLLRSGIEIQPCESEKSKGEKEGTDKGKEKESTEDGEDGEETEIPQDVAKKIGKYTGVTDHNIYGFRFTLKGGGNITPAKLQVAGEISICEPVQAGGGGDKGEKKEKKVPFLLNVCINAHGFLAREFEEEEEPKDGVCTLTYEFRAPINNSNFVVLDVYTGQPIVHIKNSGEETVEGGKIHPEIEKTLSELNIFIEETIRKGANNTQGSQLRENKQKWKAAGLGCVAHEIGTLPMGKRARGRKGKGKGKGGEGREGIVDENLKFHAFRNLYACDMSVLPVSAPANPSLTLVALALRLADHLIAQDLQEHNQEDRPKPAVF